MTTPVNRPHKPRTPAATVELTCANPQCRKTFTRRAARVREATLTYCSKRCATVAGFAMGRAIKAVDRAERAPRLTGYQKRTLAIRQGKVGRALRESAPAAIPDAPSSTDKGREAARRAMLPAPGPPVLPVSERGNKW